MQSAVGDFQLSDTGTKGTAILLESRTVSSFCYLPESIIVLSKRLELHHDELL